MKSKNRRVKSEAVQLNYISPWKYQETYRNDIQTLMSKNKILEEIKPLDQQIGKTYRASISPSKQDHRINLRHNTNRMYKTLGDFKRYKPTSFFPFALTQNMRWSTQKQLNEQKINEKIIFVKKHKDSRRPKVVTLGNQRYCIEHNSSNTQWVKMPMPLNSHQHNDNNDQSHINKPSFHSKKHYKFSNYFKNQIEKSKVMKKTLENCLKNIQSTNSQQKSTKMLSKTLKQFLSTKNKF